MVSSLNRQLTPMNIPAPSVPRTASSSPEILSTKFSTPAPGYWAEVAESDWNNWRWQLKNRVTTLEQLESLLELTPSERGGVAVAGTKLALAITPHFFN